MYPVPVTANEIEKLISINGPPSLADGGLLSRPPGWERCQAIRAVGQPSRLERSVVLRQAGLLTRRAIPKLDRGDAVGANGFACFGVD